MKRSKGFLLTEIIMSIALQAGFILTLCVSFYTMISFYTRTQQLLSAREKGERVISYIDSRIVHAGLGLSKCTTPLSIRNALQNITELNSDDIILPVSITSNKGTNKNLNKNGKITTYTGNILTLLYARKELDSDRDFIVLTDSTLPEAIEPGEAKKFSTFISNVNARRNEYELSQFTKLESFMVNENKNIKACGVLVGSGVPLLLSKSNPYNRTGKFFNITAPRITPSNKSVDIYPGDEFLYLDCEKMFVAKDSTGAKNFSFQTLSDEWSRAYYYEKDILEIYMELGTEENDNENQRIFTLYVLASGGYDSSMNHEKPAAWPENANWEEDYRHNMLYVSRKSWRLKNLESFHWN